MLEKIEIYQLAISRFCHAFRSGASYSWVLSSRQTEQTDWEMFAGWSEPVTLHVICTLTLQSTECDAVTAACGLCLLTTTQCLPV